MTPKEKAKELSMKFDKLGETDNAKKCALIAVDEIIKVLGHDDLYIQGETNIDDFINYWQEVKQEIENI
jgi:hypothetical protein